MGTNERQSVRSSTGFCDGEPLKFTHPLHKFWLQFFYINAAYSAKCCAQLGDTWKTWMLGIRHNRPKYHECVYFMHGWHQRKCNYKRQIKSHAPFIELQRTWDGMNQDRNSTSFVSRATEVKCSWGDLDSESSVNLHILNFTWLQTLSEEQTKSHDWWKTRSRLFSLLFRKRKGFSSEATIFAG